MTSIQARLATPPPTIGTGAALAIIDLLSPDPASLDDLVQRLTGRQIRAGDVRLADLRGIDRGLVARWNPGSAQVMPHGGSIIVKQIAEFLIGAGCTWAEPDAPMADPTGFFPEAEDRIEACMLDTLGRAASPLALSVLLRQRDLWRSAKSAPCSLSEARMLDRLLTPPTVVLIGRPNVGKSSLTNAMAQRHISIVADEPGTTRDHIGVELDLAGFIVRWIDAPGLREAPDDPVERSAIQIALAAARSADLILLCAEEGDSFDELASFVPGSTPALRVGTKSDIDAVAGADVHTAAVIHAGLTELGELIRETMVPSGLRMSERRWRFHPGLPA